MSLINISIYSHSNCYRLYLLHMPYFKKLQQLLQKEKEADIAAYQKLSKEQNMGQKRLAGHLWYPIAIKNQEISRGDYLDIEVERTTHNNLLHQFRYGVQVALFSNHQAESDRLEGTVIFASKDRMKINFRIEELPAWASNGKLGIELLFDMHSYEQMHQALLEGEKMEDHHQLSTLSNVLIGEQEPTFSLPKEGHVFPSLNKQQRLALDKILAAEELAIVHGPPGTGKTTTLVEAIKNLLQFQQKQLLVVAPSNAAVDLLTYKLAQEALHVVRIGNPIRFADSLFSESLDQKLAEHPLAKENRTLKKQAGQLRDMAHKYKRKFGPQERAQRNALFANAREIMREVEQNEKLALAAILGDAQVITATLVGANHPSIRQRTFEIVIIDEATQALEPACWIPILKAKKLVMAGDHRQLPPTVKSTGVEAKALMHTLMEKCVERFPEAVVSLHEQYRMHTSIMQFPSEQFYSNTLTAHPVIAEKLLFAGDSPVQFVDTAGCGFDEKNEDGSISNPEEASFVIQRLAQYIRTPDINMESKAPSIGIVSPYRKQVAALKEFFEASALSIYKEAISINTIDSFQGQERDIICISMCRSNAERNIGFLADTRRMNVAMTRARKKLMIIGDSSTLSANSFYEKLLNYCEQAGFYKSAWEFLEY